MSERLPTGKNPIVIGVIHLPPLPGSPRYQGDTQSLVERVRHDAEALASGGVDAVIVENFGDSPFCPESVSALTISHFTVLAHLIAGWTKLPMGINVLRNDACSALAIAHATGSAFIRVNILTGARVTDQGVIQGKAHELLRLRSQLAPREIQIFADIDVKHSAPLAVRPLEEEAAETLFRGGADGLIVSGTGTGKETSVETMRTVRKASLHHPLFVGSGVTEQNARSYLPEASGFIIGTYFKSEGRTENAVDATRVKRFMASIR